MPGFLTSLLKTLASYDGQFLNGFPSSSSFEVGHKKTKKIPKGIEEQ